MEIHVCMGGSCHMKGCYNVLQHLRQLVAERGLSDRVALGAQGCAGRCREGVSVLVDGVLHTGVSPTEVDDFFDRVVHAALRGEGRRNS